MEVVFLGTGSMFPTKERNHTSVYLSFRGEHVLFDCGEGTQRQLRIMGISPTKITRVFLTHWHGDHSLGLAGFIQSNAASQRNTPLHVYGPLGTRDRVNSIMKTYVFKLNYPLYVHDVDEGVIFENDYMFVSAFKVKHTTSTLGFCLKEKDRRKINLDYTKKFGLVRHPLLGRLQKGEDIEYKGHTIRVEDATYVVRGRKICYVVDTVYFSDLVNYVQGADLLICESTYLKEDEREEYMHMSAEDAAKLAKSSQVKKLILTHFSQRYKDVTPLVEEAKRIFNNVEAAHDFMKIEV